ncbi:hypothetical protein ACHAPU_008790 [Fusarium lateritium]
MATTEAPIITLFDEMFKSANPRNNRKLPVVGYLARVKTVLDQVAATTTQWGEKYEWDRRFGHRVKVKAIVQENIPFINLLRATDEEVDDMVTFMIPHPSSPRWEDRLTQVQEFCEGADFSIQNFVPDIPGNSRLRDAQEPKAWVFDCSLVPQANVHPQDLDACLLNNAELYKVLQQKRFSTDIEVETASSIRRIYINNPNGVSILALLRTAPASQVFGLRNLFASYLNPNPVPELGASDLDWWHSCFLIAYTLPFLAIGTQNRSDTRTFSNDKSLRARYDIEFLNLKYQISPRIRQDSSCVPENAVLHVAVFSLMVTGRSEHYSTTVCLDDDFFDEESRLMNAEEIENLGFGGSPDPIIYQPNAQRAPSPRAYSIMALSKELEKIVEYHGNDQECLKKSLDIYTSIPDGHSTHAAVRQKMEDWRKRFPIILNKLIHFNSRLADVVNHFLIDDIMVGSDDVPYGKLWQGLQDEPEAIKSLRAVKGFCGKLRDIGIGLEHLKDTLEDVRRESKNFYAVEQQSRDKTVVQVTIAAFVLAIMNLIAQVYAGKPGYGDSAAWPGFISMVVIFNLICIPGILWSAHQYRSRKKKAG